MKVVRLDMLQSEAGTEPCSKLLARSNVDRAVLVSVRRVVNQIRIRTKLPEYLVSTRSDCYQRERGSKDESVL